MRLKGFEVGTLVVAMALAPLQQAQEAANTPGVAAAQSNTIRVDAKVPQSLVLIKINNARVTR